MFNMTHAELTNQSKQLTQQLYLYYLALEDRMRVEVLDSNLASLCSSAVLRLFNSWTSWQFLLRQEIHYRVHNSPTPVPITSQNNPVHNFPAYIFLYLHTRYKSAL